MTNSLRIVDVKTGQEVSRAEVQSNGTVTYTGGDSARSVVENYVRDNGSSAAEAVAALNLAGWSNGYLMVDLKPA